MTVITILLLDFASYDKHDLHKWATNNAIAKSQADYISTFFTPTHLLALSASDLQKHKKLAGVTVTRLVAALQTVKNQEEYAHNSFENKSSSSSGKQDFKIADLTYVGQ